MRNTAHYLYPVILLVLIAAIFPFAYGIIPVVNFTSEKIDVHIYPDEVVVEGWYVYKNPHPFPVVQGFSIPFPVDKEHPEPVEVYVERLVPGKEEIKLKRIFGNTGFDVYFPAKENIEIRVLYRQKAGGGKATYILTTTKPWGRPLEKGIYVLYPHGTAVESSNYQFNLRDGALGFFKTGFMPEKDWQFTWRKDYEKGS